MNNKNIWNAELKDYDLLSAYAKHTGNIELIQHKIYQKYQISLTEKQLRNRLAYERKRNPEKAKKTKLEIEKKLERLKNLDQNYANAKKEAENKKIQEAIAKVRENTNIYEQANTYFTLIDPIEFHKYLDEVKEMRQCNLTTLFEEIAKAFNTTKGKVMHKYYYANDKKHTLYGKINRLEKIIIDQEQTIADQKREIEDLRDASIIRALNDTKIEPEDTLQQKIRKVVNWFKKIKK